MDIKQFIAWINKKNGWSVDAAYYTNVLTWRDWWKGYYRPVHQYFEVGLDGKQRKRTMYRMRMAKKVCEDWASLLLNEKTTITLNDSTSQRWLQGDEQTGGRFAQMQFWPKSNELVEKTFWSGTGAWVMSVTNMLQQGKQVVLSPDAEIQMDYLAADCILPITVERGAITEAAFVSEMRQGGAPCIYLQIHKKLSDGTYQIVNQFFRASSIGGIDAFEDVPGPKGILPLVNTGCPYPWFSVFAPAVQKNIDGGEGMGISVFAEALDQIEGSDRAYNNFVKDIYLGGKKVFYNKRLFEPHINPDGTTTFVPPDDVQQQLFHQPTENESLSLDEKRDPVYEYNPNLRVEENTKAIQAALDCLSFKVGLGTHHYRFDGGTIATATQYNGDRQDMVQNANKHQTAIESALTQIVRAVLWAGKNILGAEVDPESPVTVSWDDSYITDSETRIAQERDDALSGMIPKYRYLMDRYGLPEDKAKALASEAESDAEPIRFAGGDA